MLRSLPDIQAFVRVAQALSFTKAAFELSVTPTAVSKAVARLERDLGVQLFIRTTRQVRLTEEGELFLRHCTAAFAEIEAGLEALDVLRDDTIGPVRLSAPFILGRSIAASLPELMDRHPKLDIQLTLSDQYAELADNRIDIAIRIGDTHLAPHRAAQLAQLNWVTVASPRYLQQRGYPTSLDDLAGHRCHHFVNSSGAIIPWTFGQAPELTSLTLQGGITLNQGELLIELALADGGIVQVFDYMVADLLRRGELVRLFPELEAAGPQVYAITLHGREKAPKIKATLLHLQQRFEQL